MDISQENWVKVLHALADGFPDEWMVTSPLHDEALEILSGLYGRIDEFDIPYEPISPSELLALCYPMETKLPFDVAFLIEALQILIKENNLHYGADVEVMERIEMRTEEYPVDPAALAEKLWIGIRMGFPDCTGIGKFGYEPVVFAGIKMHCFWVEVGVVF